MPVKKNTKVAATVPVTEVPEPSVVAPEPIVETPAVVECPLNVIFQKVTDMMALGREITTLVKSFQKDYAKILKASSKKKTNANRRSPSGFNKPAKLNPDLCAFLDLPEGSELARTNVTRQLNVYIKEHNLQNPENKKHILPDEKLATLLNLTGGDQQLSYFNLQRFMKHLFI